MQFILLTSPSTCCSSPVKVGGLVGGKLGEVGGEVGEVVGGDILTQN